MTFGFSYDGSTYETLRFGDSTNTEAYGISGSNIVGRYFDGSGYHSFLYDGSTYHSLNWLDAAQSRAYGIDGTKIVGSYTGTDGSDRGFLYDGSTFTTLSGPSATLTDAMGIDGGRVVGTYFDSGSPYASFLYDGSQTETIVISEQLSAQTYRRRWQHPGWGLPGFGGYGAWLHDHDSGPRTVELRDAARVGLDWPGVYA
jgi:hypothetical protein